MPREQAHQRALWLLTTGSVVGVLLGLLTAIHRFDAGGSMLPGDAIALVNNKVILTEEYERAVAMVANDKRTEITEADRAHILHRLIEEELLVQHAITIGLVDNDRSVRQVITQAMLDSIAAESVSAQPTEAAEHHQRARDDALREYLQWLRSEAKIAVAPTFLP